MHVPRDIVQLQPPETFGFFHWLPDSARIVASTSAAASRGGVVLSTVDGTVVSLDQEFPPLFHIHPDGRRFVFPDGIPRLVVWRLSGVSSLVRH